MRFWFRQVLNEYLKQKWWLILFVLVFFCMGIAFGAVAVKTISTDQADHLSGYLNGFLENVSTTPLSEQVFFRHNILNNLYVMIAIGLLGMTVVGIPLVLVTVFSRGFVLGFTVGFLVRAKAVKGFAFALVSMLPHNLLIIPSVILGAVTALSFSALLVRKRFSRQNYKITGRLGAYAMVMLILCMVTGAAGLLETYLTPVIVRTAAIYLR